MTIWRQILTALWCALQGGTAAWAVREALLPMIMADIPFTDLPTAIQVTLVCLIAIAAFSLLALVWIPLLIGAVVAIVILMFYAMFALGDAVSLSAAADIAVVWYALAAAFFIVPSLAFVIWNHGEKTKPQAAQKAAAAQF